MRDWRKTILSQYDNSPRLLSLIAGEDAEIDPAADIASLYIHVFDPRTATGWGLDCWGGIVGIGRSIELASDPAAFGFAGSKLRPFGQGPFFSTVSTSTYRLADTAYRMLIFFKAAINLTNSSLRDLNRIMQVLFKDRGTCWVLHTGTMRIRFGFDFVLRPYERALLLNQSTPPAPAGVGYDFYEAPRAQTFGFAGSGLRPFGQGTFARRPYYADSQDA